MLSLTFSFPIFDRGSNKEDLRSPFENWLLPVLALENEERTLETPLSGCVCAGIFHGAGNRFSEAIDACLSEL